MPVNMDPGKRKQKRAASQETSDQSAPGAEDTAKRQFGEETELDREKAIAEAEWKNLWDATEVIDMDKW
ncbi:MAG: hypothetical protein AB7G68_06420 [Nitrospiraceae bacterium]